MRLATIEVKNPKNGEERRDGALIVVSSDHRRGVRVNDERCLTMRRAVDNWSEAAPILEQLSQALEHSSSQGQIDLSQVTFKAPLPRASDFIDGSSYLSHVERVRKARGAAPPEDIKTNPLVYRGIPTFMGAREDIEVVDFKDGPDCEAELAVILGDVPAGVKATDALDHILLVTQINDVSLRHRIKMELPKQFGFLNGKPISVAGPIAVTPDELGAAWNQGRPKLTMKIEKNGACMGELDTAELHFSLPELIAHAAMTHNLGAGTIVGTGTISNADSSRGVACLAEQVALDMIEKKSQITPFLAENDLIEIESKINGRSIFGKMINRYVAAKKI